MSVQSQITRITNAVVDQAELIAQIKTELQGKTAATPGESEEWVFTMEDGSTVTKEVYVE